MFALIVACVKCGKEYNGITRERDLRGAFVRCEGNRCNGRKVRFPHGAHCPCGKFHRFTSAEPENEYGARMLCRSHDSHGRKLDGCGAIFSAERAPIALRQGIGRFTEQKNTGAMHASRTREKIDISADALAPEQYAILEEREREDIETGRVINRRSTISAPRAMIVYLRTGNKFRRAFESACLRLQVDYAAIPDTENAYRVWTWELTDESGAHGRKWIVRGGNMLSELLEVAIPARDGAEPIPCIVEWHNQLSASIPRGGSGQGEKKVRPSHSMFGSATRGFSAPPVSKHSGEVAEPRPAIETPNPHTRLY